eukprot:TRINITY_DN60713_c0_g1_i1.p4 TRINITY_DN60713_c0_g1~~TRINITY_DN60713_c0_g1_i1.p4  ORF type:complete len:157 (-),score=29.44 TRINITY_DN60713_c0_g1_i1:299-769(-)
MSRDSRDRMLDELKQGVAGEGGMTDDMSHKKILVRGCDPVMAERSKGFLPPLLGNVQMQAATDDDTFFHLLEEQKYDAVVFAPGAVRHNAAKNPIPGGNKQSAGWSLKEYSAYVESKQGKDVPIVGSGEEREMVPVIRGALGMDGVEKGAHRKLEL